MKSVVFTYGRFNPPHLGHKMMIKEIIKMAKREKKTPVVVVSHSTGNNKNPMTVASKIRIIKTWFPKLDVISSSKEQSIAKISKTFKDDSIMVIGQNRKNSFKFLPFKKVSINRPNYAPSATAARTAASAKNAKTFKKLTGYNIPPSLTRLYTRRRSQT
jgi:cytidyltransferase-like protein